MIQKIKKAILQPARSHTPQPARQREKYMRQAIKAARQAEKRGGVAIGAVLVRDITGKVVAKGGSIVGITKDPTAHAEVNCIRSLCKRLGRDDLYGYTLYSTLEPCHMCLSCAAWARIPRIYFGAYRKDVDRNLFDTNHMWGDEKEAKYMNLRENRQMYVHGGILEEECARLLAKYHDNPRHSGQPATIARAHTLAS